MIQTTVLLDPETNDRLYVLHEQGLFHTPIAILDDDDAEQLSTVYQTGRTAQPVEPVTPFLQAFFEFEDDDERKFAMKLVGLVQRSGCTSFEGLSAYLIAPCTSCQRPRNEGDHSGCIEL